VYFDESKKLSLAELSLSGRVLDAQLENARNEEIAGVPYLTFETPASLSDADIAALSQLSFSYALFERNEATLLPIPLARHEAFSTDIGSLLKYSGKTNEIFTRMMINIVLYSSDFARSSEIALLDPLAMKGTTLFEAAMLGYDAYGIEIVDKPVHEAQIFFKKFLESERFKHEFHQERLGLPDKKSMTTYQFTYAPDKDTLRDAPRKLWMVCGDARYAAHVFRKDTFHLLVGDLPYGVAHGSSTGDKRGAPTRNPAELIKLCLPAWRQVMKRGAALALSWNSFVLSRDALAQVLRDGGLDVFTGGAYDQLEHRVDQAIRRDVVIARKM